MFDLNTIMSNRIAVRCKTEEQAEAFVECVWQYEPGACSYWRRKETHWDVYQQDTCYSLFDEDGDPALHYSPDCEYMDDGYKIIDFSEVVFATVDFGELDPSGVNVAALFGME